MKSISIYPNLQPISKAVREESDRLLLHSIFHTIQGEGPLTGHPAIFVRFGGCNLRCPQCDTQYTEGERMTTVSGILQEVQRLHAGPRLVVITGGEPFRQPYALGLLTHALEDADYQVQIETNGTLPVYALAPNTWVVVSPKTGKVHPSISEVAVAWKYVLNADSVREEDGLPITALEHPAHPYLARPPVDFPREAIYVSPADSVQHAVQFDRQLANERNLRAAIDSCMKHGYTLNLQVHKLLGME